MKSLPLHVRLPSPPRPFVGREADLARLRSARDAGARVIVLTGAPGVGKTALLAEHLGRHEAVERVIFVDMGAAPTEGGARGPLLDALLAAAPDATPPPADDGARDAWLVDTAEAGAFTVVLDGLERAHAGADALVAALGRHARRSAWWITSRGLAPAPSAALVPVPLGPMATDELIELARFVATAAGLDPARADAAAARAHGAPWLMLARLTPSAPRPVGLAQLLEPPLRALTRLVADAREPAPRAVAEALVGADGAWEAGIARGLVRADDDGALALAPAVALWAREALGAPEPEDLARQLAAWRSDPAPTSQLAALRVALRRGDLPVARELLDASGARMLATGLGVALWQLMEPLTDSLVTDWRDVVAVDVGAIDELDDDAAQEVSLRIARAKLLGLRGDHAAAFAVAQRVWDDATAAGDPAGRVRAALVLAPSLINAGEHRRVATLLEDLRADTLHDRLSLASYRATALAFLDQEDQAAALLRSALEPHAEELGGLPMSVRHRIAGACFVLDERAWVRRLVAPEIDGALSASLLPVRFALVHAALCAIENGQLDEAATLAARLAPTGHDGVATYADFHELIVRVELAFAKGELRVAQAALQAARDVPRRRVDDEHVTLVNTLRALHAAEPPTAPAPAELGEVASQLAVATARHHLRHDPRVSWPTLPRWLTTHRRTRRALPLQLRAEHALLAGDTAAALRHAEQALREARNGGLRIVEGELTGLVADLHAIDGRWADMVAAARELADLATATGAPRFAADAALYEAIGAPDDGLDWAALERVAADLEPSPVSSRRARALLAWDEVPLDRVDELVLARVARDHGPAGRRVIGRDVAAGPRWGLDLGRRDVWSAAAGWLALPADGVGWRLLERLGEGDGWADNEALVSAVWGVEKYKPHVHDNRLHVAVYKLRRALAGAGDAAAAADHIVRDGDGYALAGRCLVVTRG